MNLPPGNIIYRILAHSLAPAGMALIWLINGFLAVLLELPFALSLFLIFTAIVSFWLTEQAQKRL